MRGRLPALIPGLFLVATFFPFSGLAQESSTEACFACHSDRGLATSRKGRTVSLFVDAKKFSGSVHAALGCTGCHADVEGKDYPHETPLARVTCGYCHSGEEEQHAKSLHGRALSRKDPLAPGCAARFCLVCPGRRLRDRSVDYLRYGIRLPLGVAASPFGGRVLNCKPSLDKRPDGSLWDFQPC